MSRALGAVPEREMEFDDIEREHFLTSRLH
jgi:hypothetical protein